MRTEEHGLSDYIWCKEKGSNRLFKKLIKEKTKREYQENKRATKEQEWKEKALHSQFTKIADKTYRKQTYKLMKNGYIKNKTEGLITASQDQALPTR